MAVWRNINCPSLRRSLSPLAGSSEPPLLLNVSFDSLEGAGMIPQKFLCSFFLTPLARKPLEEDFYRFRVVSERGVKADIIRRLTPTFSAEVKRRKVARYTGEGPFWIALSQGSWRPFYPRTMVGCSVAQDRTVEPCGAHRGM